MTELVRRTTHEVTAQDALRLSKSRLVPEKIHKDPASVEYMMRIGAALGIDPTSAFQHIFVFEDKKTKTLKAGMSAHLMGALALAAGHRLHVEGDALSATARLIRRTTDEEVSRFRALREEERAGKLALLDDMQRLYDFQRRQILDRIADLKDLAALDEKPAEEEIAKLRQQLTELHGQYRFDQLRKALEDTRFDLGRILHFESKWTMQRARNIKNLTDKPVWTDYGPEMLKSRAKSSVVRDGAIDVILGVKNFMANLGVTFSGNVDDEVAMANVLYTPEELGADVDANGVPIQGEVVDVTDEQANPRYARTMNAARSLVDRYDVDGLLKWAETTAGQDTLSAENKISRIEAVIEAAREAGKAEELVPRGDQEATLSAHLESIVNTLR